jgi:hypothetical protein
MRLQSCYEPSIRRVHAPPAISLWFFLTAIAQRGACAVSDAAISKSRAMPFDCRFNVVKRSRDGYVMDVRVSCSNICQQSGQQRDPMRIRWLQTGSDLELELSIEKFFPNGSPKWRGVQAYNMAFVADL